MWLPTDVSILYEADNCRDSQTGRRRQARFALRSGSCSIIRIVYPLSSSDLDIFDLPIPIAIFVVIAWIFVCSATFCIWEHDWDYFVAFYFFFISLRYVVRHVEGAEFDTTTKPTKAFFLFPIMSFSTKWSLNNLNDWRTGVVTTFELYSLSSHR